MYKQEQSYQQAMPELLAMQKKPTPSALRLSKNNSQQKYRSKAEQAKINPSQVQQLNRDNLIRVQPPNNKAPKIDEDKQRANRKVNQISKNLISEMMNKISQKSVAEENYPISNETVERLIVSIDEEIKDLNGQFSKFEHSLLLNPTNQHLKKQKEAIEKKLNQTRTIKELYNQKIQSRNKISQLQSKITELKNQNRQLKIKIARGIQKIQSHIHNLPCQRQKELIEQVNKHKQALHREKEMRLNLEQNIHSINLNFKRVYKEADDARKMVNAQLKEISQKQQELKAKEDKFKHHRCQNKAEKSAKGDNLLGTSDIFTRRITNKFSQQQNIAQIINQINFNEPEEGLIRNRTNSIKIPPGLIGKTKNNYEGSSSLGAAKMQLNDTSKPKFNLEEQIERMRMNQTQFSKIAKKKNL